MRIGRRYEALRRLGDGGMGTVWVARDHARGRAVALKFMASELMADPEMLERFRREIRLLESIEHPCMVRAFGDGVLPDGLPYLVMEYVPGEDLHTRIHRLWRLPVEETRRIVDAIASALSTLHARGVIHRDVKPANILVDREGAIKLADFGLAHEAGAAQVTQVNTVMGTPTYMSPERLCDGEVDPRSDLWSLAAVAYHCLTGHPPFDGKSFGAICMAIGQGKMQQVTKTRSDLPPALDAWFARALSPSVRARFASADELSRTFARACEGVAPKSTLASLTEMLLAPIARSINGVLVPREPSEIWTEDSTVTRCQGTRTELAPAGG